MEQLHDLQMQLAYASIDCYQYTTTIDDGRDMQQQWYKMAVTKKPH